MKSSLSKSKIIKLFGLLNEELEAAEVFGELYLLGGAVMCLAFNARASTKDVDGVFKPSAQVRKSAENVAIQAGVSSDWLNDAVKGFLSDKAVFEDYLHLSNLKVYTASPEYLLSMKCLAMRIGEEFHDLDDVRFLLRYLNIVDYHQAVSVISSFYPLERFPKKTLYVLEELLELRG